MDLLTFGKRYFPLHLSWNTEPSIIKQLGNPGSTGVSFHGRGKGTTTLVVISIIKDVLLGEIKNVRYRGHTQGFEKLVKNKVFSMLHEEGVNTLYNTVFSVGSAIVLSFDNSEVATIEFGDSGPTPDKTYYDSYYHPGGLKVECRTDPNVPNVQNFVPKYIIGSKVCLAIDTSVTMVVTGHLVTEQEIQYQARYLLGNELYTTFFTASELTKCTE